MYRAEPSNVVISFRHRKFKTGYIWRGRSGQKVFQSKTRPVDSDPGAVKFIFPFMTVDLFPSFGPTVSSVPRTQIFSSVHFDSQ